MTDFKLPDLPSDEELGITDEDREAQPEADAPELSEEERRALGLGEAPPAPPSGGAPPKAKKTKKKPPEAPGPRSRWRGPVTLAVLVAAAWATSSRRTVPSPAAANAPDTAFSSARAMSMDVEIARTAHPTGSPAHERVRQFVVGRLRDVGLDPQIETTTAMIGRETRVRAATVRNVVARMPGTASTGAVLLVAHYDGAGISLAAGDDGAGVVAVLEAVRALRAGPPLKNDVIVLISDAEEEGLLGAQAFVDEHPWMADVQVVLNFEMRGGGGPSIMFETGNDNGWIVRAMQDAGIRPWTNALFYEVYKRLPNDTDFTRFRNAGKQGLNFAGISRASVYHQTYDEPSNLSEALLQHHGDNLLGMARWLGNATLTQVDAPDVTYFTLPWFGVMAYSGAFVLPVAAWMLLLAVLVLLAVLRFGGRWPGLLVGLGLGVVSAGLTGAVGWGLMRWLPRFHPEYGALVGSAFHHEGWYTLALVGSGLLIVTVSFGLARRWVAAPTLAWGALLLPLAGALYLSFRMPSAAANLQWPVVAAYLGAAVLLMGGSRTAMFSWIVALAMAIPVMVFLTPAVELLWLGLSFRAAPVLGVLVAVGLILLLPALYWLREPNWWWAPVTALVLGAAFLGLGIRVARPTAQLPYPSTLAWAFDHGTGEALWVTRGEGASPAAQAWATARAGAQLTESRPLDAFGYRSGAVVAPAQPVEVPAVQAWVLADSTVGTTRRMRLALRSAIGAELMQLRFPEQGATRVLSLNGHALPIEGRPELVEHWGDPAPAVIVDLELPQGAAVDMDVVEHLLRPGELVGAEHFTRPPELAPNVVWMSDRAMVLTPASALALQYGPPPFTIPSGEEAPPAVEPAGGEAPAEAPAAVDSVGAAVPDTGASARPDTARPDTSGAAPDTTARRR